MRRLDIAMLGRQYGLKSSKYVLRSGVFSFGVFGGEENRDYNPQNVTYLPKIPRLYRIFWNILIMLLILAEIKILSELLFFKIMNIFPNVDNG